MKRMIRFNRTGILLRIAGRSLCILAAAATLLYAGQAALAAGKETEAVLSEETYRNEADSSIVRLECTYDGSEISYDREARIVADTPAEVLPGAYSDVMTAGDTGYLPYGVRLTLIDETSSITELTAAVWSEKNGQDDLAWKEMHRINGIWHLAFDLADSDDPQLYHIHLYGAAGSKGVPRLLDGLTLTVRQYSGRGSGTAHPAPGFDAGTYYNRYPDLQSAIGLDEAALYRHYLAYGIREGRSATADYSAIFDADYYLAAYQDLRAAFGADRNAALKHFTLYGMREGRQGSPNFNVFTYRNAYPDLSAAFGGQLVQYYYHYLNFGIAENRTMH